VNEPATRTSDSSRHGAPRWLLYLGLWLLLSCIFASQLFLAGFTSTWPQAFSAELVYWLSWGILAPAVFFMCRRVYPRGWLVYAPTLLLGALVTALLEPLIAQEIERVQGWLRLCIGDCRQIGPPFTREFLAYTARVAGVNLPVYAGFVLAWHASSYYRESRNRALKSVELESLLHQSQLQALRSQLNPHFLFNSLHSIAELVHSNPKLAEQLLVRLGELLRQVLRSSTQPETPLAEELDFIRGYLDIEQMRLGDRLRVVWEIEPEAARMRVPSLILQPLVENAIQHGVAAATSPATLTIRARLEGARLHLQVSDTGPGFARAGTPGRTGIGLANTRVRLERLYGANHRLDLAGTNGCVVDLRIPAAP
jgi:two-component system LytT family sensor kinase